MSGASTTRRAPRPHPFSILTLPVSLMALLLATAAQPASAQTEHLNAQMNMTTRGAPPPATTPNPNCTIIVPANPLTAQGLSTPYQLEATVAANGPCQEYNTAQSAFVQAAVINPKTGAISVYDPLVIDAGTRPAAPPVVPQLPEGGIVAIWFGFNGGNLTLAPARAGSNELAQANCVNGLNGSVFTQVAYCNAPAFFTAANAAIAKGQLTIPALATAKDGEICPTTRSFFVVDQDQSDNLTTAYLVTKSGQLAQYTKANVAALSGAMMLTNASDNGLLVGFMDPALNCQPLVAPDLADPGEMTTAQPLNELQAREAQPAPVALVPAGDPMVEVNGSYNLQKTNLYRAGVDQPAAATLEDADTGRYCRELLRGAPQRLFSSTVRQLFTATASPAPATANNLWTFVVQRWAASYSLLNCQTLIDEPDPISLTTSSAGVVTNASLNTQQLYQILRAIAPYEREDLEADSVANSQ